MFFAEIDSMNRRPWPIVILALIQLVIPLFNIGISALASGLSVSNFFTAQMQFVPMWKIFVFYLMAPMSGLAIYMCKKWSFFAFMSFQMIILATNIVEIQGQSNVTLAIPIVIFAANTGLLIYFMLPAVQRVYFDDRLKWWETKPRYIVDIEMDTKGAWGMFPGTILNISEGGCNFRTTDSEKLLKKSGKVVFNVLGKRYILKGKVAFAKETKNGHEYGIMFTKMNEKKILEIKNLIGAIHKLGFKKNIERLNWKSDFTKWFNSDLVGQKNLLPQTESEKYHKKTAKKTKKKAA
jgi:hypothetical protein